MLGCASPPSPRPPPETRGASAPMAATPPVPRPLVLIVMDGYGINPRTDANAIAMARKPNLDRIARDWPHTQLATSGPAVGLPEGQMGNSEVGHLHIGARKPALHADTHGSAAPP